MSPAPVPFPARSNPRLRHWRQWLGSRLYLPGAPSQELTSGCYPRGARRCFSVPRIYCVSVRRLVFVGHHDAATGLMRAGELNNFRLLLGQYMNQLFSLIAQLDCWVTSRTIAHSRLPQVAATISTLGYLILWSDRFDAFLTSSKLHISFATWRLHFIWWGALFLLIGLLIYWWRCPRPVKRAGSAEDYLALQFPLPDNYRLAKLKETVEKFVAQNQDKENDEIVLGSLTKHVLFKTANSGLCQQTTADLLRFDWEWANKQAALSRRSAAISMILGAFLFLMPSLDVTVRVLRLLFASIWP